VTAQSTVDGPAWTAGRHGATGGPRPGTALRLALAGSRSDVARVVLTALGSAAGTLGLLAVATVLSITGGIAGSDEDQARRLHYSNPLLNEPGLRPGLAVALALLTIPVLFFVAQCGRLGAPARDRRLAAYRLAGATPGDTVRIAAAESGLAAALGAALGAAAYFAGRVLADAPDRHGDRPLPTDVLPPAPVVAAILVGVPLLAVVLSALLLRRVTVSPFGVVRRVRTARPRLWPGVLLLAGLGVFVFGALPLTWYARHHRGADLSGPVTVLIVLPVLLVCVGLVSGTGWLAYATGRLAHRRARRPALLLATRRMAADPWSGARAVTAVLVAALFGAGAALIRSGMVTSFRANDLFQHRYAAASHEPYVPQDTRFYTSSLDLVDVAVWVGLAIAVAGLLVALVEGLVSRRRSLAAAVATGIPRGTLARAVLLQSLLSTAPALLVAVTAGAFIGWRFSPGSTVSSAGDTQCVPATGDPITACDQASYAQAHTVPLPAISVHLDTPVPWVSLGVLFGGAVALVLLTTAASLLFLPASTTVTELRAD
jgi:hypothetical protein